MANRGSGWRRYEHRGFEILVGRGARDNDRLTFSEAAPGDLWLHAAGYAGSHVIVRRVDEAGEPPRDVVEMAARLASHHSKARQARGKVEVHVCRAADVRKPRGFAPGQVQLKRWESLKVYPGEPIPESR